MPLKPAVDWDAKLKQFPGQTNKEKIELLKHQHTWVGIGGLLDVQGQTVSHYYSRCLKPKPAIQPVPRVRYGRRVDYLKGLKAYMKTPAGDKIREYNRLLLKSLDKMSI